MSYGKVKLESQFYWALFLIQLIVPLKLHNTYGHGGCRTFGVCHHNNSSRLLNLKNDHWVFILKDFYSSKQASHLSLNILIEDFLWQKIDLSDGIYCVIASSTVQTLVGKN